MTNAAAGALGAVLIVIVLIDIFETLVLPRRVTRTLRLARLLYRVTWGMWRRLARLARSSRRREAILSVYGPLSLLLLLIVWTFCIIVGFALLQWANGSSLRAPEGHADFGVDLYFSASTLFTLGLGDVVPRADFARPLAMFEAAGGFGVLALVIGYLPSLYGSFSRREVAVSLLDARAGSPPSAGELLRRYLADNMGDGLDAYLREWELWSAELMESHLSYPMLAYFRSQHDNQNWLAALTTILDTCAFALAGLPELPRRSARLTFAMGRHAVVDLSQIFRAAPITSRPDRLTPRDVAWLRQTIAESGLTLTEAEAMEQKLTKLRAEYEPYVEALSRRLELPLPPWAPPPHVTENWRSTEWDPGGDVQF